MKKKQKIVERRVARPTLILMGEGYAEVSLLRILRQEYTSNNQGVRLTIANAYGKGARNVVQQAIARCNGFDSAGALFDTDTDWDDEVRKLGKKNGIQLLPCDPCIEAFLLQVVGLKPRPTSAQNKAAFAQHFGGEAHAPGVLAKHITREKLNAAEALGLQPLIELLRLIRGG